LARIEKSVLTELVISNSLPKPVDYNGMYSNNKINVISMAKQIGIAMSAINSSSSYEGLKKERW
jgi:phosphoribosylpyrophosphate synthetase